ncbi:hypothetical protein ACWIVY_10895, partial [Ursidibacter sp. B-7004-1]
KKTHKGVFMANEETKKIQITLTMEEYETLARLAELQGKPMATIFMDFVREANTFVVLKKVVSATEKIVSIKSIFRKKNSEVLSSIT